MELINYGPSEAGAHRIQSILSCPRQYALGRSSMGEALVRGCLTHTVLAHVYARRLPGGEKRFLKPNDALVESARINNEETPSDYWAKWAKLLLPLADRYVAFWTKEPMFEVVDVERELRVRMPDGSLYTCRVDMIFRHRAKKKIFFLEHKSAYATIPKVANRYALSGQIAGQRLVGRVHYGAEYGGVILNLIKMPNDKDPTFAFARPTLPAAPAAVDDWPQTIQYAERMLALLREWYGDERENPMSWPGVFQDGHPCMGQYGPCDFRDRCRGVAGNT